MIQLTDESMKDLFGTHDIPGSPEDHKILLHWAQRLIERKGENYVRRYRKRLIRDWKLLLDIGLSRI